MFWHYAANLTGCPVADLEHMAAATFNVKLGIAGRSSIDFAHREAKPSGNETQHGRRHVAVESLNLLQDRDESASLASGTGPTSDRSAN
jgi:hypothetical protein